MKKVNISIDDVSPHPQSSIAVVSRCFEIIEKFPDAKFTLFIPMSYWRTKGPTSTKEPLQLDLYPSFCDALKQLPKKNFELCYHGFHHGIPNVSNNDEMRDLNYDDSCKLIDMMYEVADRSGLFDTFKKILRPPAWRMSPACFDACRDKGIELLALSAQPYANVTYKGRDKDFDKVVYYNGNPPFIPLKMYEKTEIVYHACEWDANYLSSDLTQQLVQFLSSDDIEFVYMEGLL